MLIVYLDDSGTERSSKVVTLAGYAGSSEGWSEFEEKSNGIMRNYEISLLHTKEFHDTKSDFTEWSRIKKQTFIQELYQAASETISVGISISVLKETFVSSKAPTGLSKNTSPIGYCFNAILDWILRDEHITTTWQNDGIRFEIEDGNANNSDIKRIYSAIRGQHALEDKL